MAIATVVNVKGEVFAVNKDGVKRRLQKGDQLQEGEVLVTAPGSSAELDMGGGKIVNVAEQQTFAVDGAIGGPAQPNAATSALESAAAAQKVVQALASGDVNALLEAEAAAAGLAGGADSGGSSFVQLLRISEGVTGVNYEFGSFSQGAVDQPTPGAIEEIIEEPTTTNPPTILVGDGELFAESAVAEAFEPALPGGSNEGGLGELVQGQFLVSDPDGVDSLVSVTINGNVILMADLVGSVIPGASGMLTITGFDPTTGMATFEYELTAVTTDVDGVEETDVFTFTTTDGTLVSNTATITITIVDDMPSISVSQEESPALVVDDSDLGTNASGNFAGLFASSFGADGAGSLVYALGFNAGGTGIVDTATGQNVVLSMNGGVVEGRTEGSDELVFTISVDGSGNVTLDQVRAVKQSDTSSDNEAVGLSAANLVTLAATITDGDGDSESAVANIGGAFSFLDDGPAVSDLNAGTINENSGDNDLGVAAEVLGIDGGMDGVKSVGIVANQVGGGTLAIVGGKLIYTAPANVDNSGAVIATFTVTVTDNDDDTVTSTVTVNIGDANTPTLTVGNASGDETDGLVNTTGTLQFGFGGDGAGVLTLSAAGATWDGDNKTLTANNGDWTLTVNNDGTYSFQQNNAITHDNPLNHDEPYVIMVTASVVDSDNSGTGDKLFTITVDDDGPSISAINLAIANVAATYDGTYSFDVGTDAQDFSGSFDSGSLVWTNPRDGYALEFDALASTSTSQVYHGTYNDGADTFFNLTVNNDGTYNFELVTPDPTTVVDIASLLAGISGGSNLPSYTIGNAAFNGQFDLLLTGYSGSHAADTLTISSTDLGVSDNVMHGNKDDVLRFDILPVGGSGSTIATLTIHVATTAGWKSTDTLNWTVHYTDGPDSIQSEDWGSDQQVVLNFDTSRTVDWVEITPDGTDAFKIDGVSLSYTVQEFPDNYQFDFQLTGSDSDQDIATANFTVAVNTTDTSTYIINGTSGSDNMYGTTGNDIFHWGVGDHGVGGAPAVDTIADFGNGTDVLDLRDLLQGESSGNLNAYLSFGYDETTQSTVISISSTGHIADGPGAVDQQIILAAVDVTNQGNDDFNTIVSTLGAKLMIDS